MRHRIPERHGGKNRNRQRSRPLCMFPAPPSSPCFERECVHDESRSMTLISSLAGQHVVVLAVEDPRSVEEVIRATQIGYPGHGVVPIWCGDPQLRPARKTGEEWFEPATDPYEWELTLVSAQPAAARATRVVAVGEELAASGVQTVTVTDVAASPTLRLPGGVEVDDVIRHLVTSGLSTGKRPPAPWSRSGEFRAWLAPQYWSELRARDPHLLSKFPEPASADAVAIATWQQRAFLDHGVSFLVDPLRSAPTRIDWLSVAAPVRRDGFNLVGYLTREMSLGDVARRINDAASAAYINISTIAYQRTGSPVVEPLLVADQQVGYDTSLAVVTADQFGFLAEDHPMLFAATSRMIGYWFWELEFIPELMVAAISLVDEIWTGSQFVTDAFAAVTDKPVRTVPIAIPKPNPSTRQRADFPMLADLGDRFVFLVVFDHFSITERKNPIGAIEAFAKAFRPNEGPVLIVKSMNGAATPEDHARVKRAAEGRPDIRIWDEHLSRADQMALVGAADCLVSLHRSEGLGLHLAEAMWLGTPTIATRYSGNVDFMDDSCALLVDAGRTNVTHGRGVYPETAVWADPDLNQAAAMMRQIMSDGALRSSLAEQALIKMQTQVSPPETGRLIAGLLGLTTSTTMDS